MKSEILKSEILKFEIFKDIHKLLDTKTDKHKTILVPISHDAVRG